MEETNVFQQKQGSLTNLIGRIQCFPLVNASTYSIYKLQDLEEEPVWQKQIKKHVITTNDENLKCQ